MQYPKRKRSVRITKLSDSVQLYEHHTGAHGRFDPIAGFLLALCNGETPLTVIKRCLAISYGVSEEEANAFVDAQIGNLAPYLDMFDIPVESDERYDFQDFFYRAAAPSVRASAPLSAQLLLTNRCNFRCSYCFNASGEERREGMETAIWVELARQLGAVGAANVDITGGEPLIRADFPEILDAMTQNGLLSTVFTNGSLITPALIKQFAATDDIIVQVSLDTPDPDAHHKLTVSKNSFSRVTESISKLAKAGVHTRVKALILPENCLSAERLIDLCADLGARSLMLDTYDICFSGRGDSGYFLSPEQSAATRELTARAKQKYAGQMSVKFQEGRKKWRDEQDIVACGALTDSFTLLPGGDIVPCDKLAGEARWAIGRFPDLSLMELWKSDKANAFVSPSLDGFVEPCASCEQVLRCKGGCPALRRFIDPNARAADPRCWKANYENSPYKS